MTWKDPNPHPIRYVGYSTGFGSSGVWEFCSNDPAERQPKGVWPMNFRFGPRDMTGGRNDGRAIGTFPAHGPDNEEYGSYRFTGKRMSRMLIPFKKSLDIRYSMTILVHVRTDVPSLPLPDFMSDSWGLLNAWKTRATPADGAGQAGQLTGRTMRTGQTYAPRRRLWPGRRLRATDQTRGANSNVPNLVPNKWTYVGISYNYRDGEVALWIDNIKVAHKLIGSAERRALFPIEVGYNGQASKPFSGQLSCLQLYDYALTREQITAASNKCKVDEFRLCDPNWHSHGSRCFRVFSPAGPYETAQAMCARHDSRVALPKDPATNAFIVQLRNKVSRQLATWIGLRDDKEEGQHVWEDGEVLGGFRAWGPGEPNNAPGDSDCVRIEAADRVMGANRWRDFPCNAGNFGVICEKGQVKKCPSGWTRLDPFCYMYVDKPASFDAADKVCKNLGASLHTASDEKGVRLMQGLARTALGTSGWVWTGQEQLEFPPPGRDNGRCKSFLKPKGGIVPLRPYMAMQRSCTRKNAFICKKG
ncbi:uncharacterized protein [Branchiostoma lanceolatum]|uniref:uncharacterized protein n=1 Tax=Branchiostoma lanceolatum TaxID=7740 RepID=UPI0034568523